MAFQPGNKDQKRPKLMFDALMLEMKACDETLGMRVIVHKLLELAASGDMQAIKEVFTRIDGLPVQVVENLNENVNYVALMPTRLKTIDAWLTNYDPETKQLTKQ